MGVVGPGVRGKNHRSQRVCGAARVSAACGVLIVSLVARGLAAQLEVHTIDLGVPHQPSWIVAGTDGHLWFIDGDGIGRLDPSSEAVVHFTIPPDASSPSLVGAARLAPAPDGSVWFTQVDIFGQADRVGRLTPDGQFGSLLRSKPETRKLAVDDAGGVWVLYLQGNIVAHITPDGSVKSLELEAGSGATDLCRGPDGDIWILQDGPGALWHARRDGVLEGRRLILYVPPVGGDLLAAGPDGNFWYTDLVDIGRVTPSGTQSVFFSAVLPLGAQQMVPGPDGSVWFTRDSDPPEPLVRVTPWGDTELYDLHIGLVGLTTGPDDNLWGTSPTTNSIVRISPPPPADSPPRWNGAQVVVSTEGALAFLQGNPLQVVDSHQTTSWILDFAVRPDGRFAYVTERLSSFTHVVDMRTHRVVRSIPLPFLGSSVVFASDGRRAYVSVLYGGITAIDATTHQVVGAIPLDCPSKIALDSAGQTALISSSKEQCGAESLNDDQVYIVDLRTGTVRSAVHIMEPGAVALTSDGTIGYVAATLLLDEGFFPGVAVVDVQEGRVVTSIRTIDRLDSIVLSPDDGVAYLAGDQDIIKLDTTSRTIVGRTANVLGLGSNALALSPDGTRLAATSNGDGQLKLFNAATLEQVAAVPVGDYLSQVAFAVSPPPVHCVGDCNADGRVDVSELVLSVRIALGDAPAQECPSLGGNGVVTIADLIAAVGSALDGCNAES